MELLIDGLVFFFCCSVFRVYGKGLRVWGFEVSVDLDAQRLGTLPGLRFRGSGSGLLLRFPGFGFTVQDSGFLDSGSGFRVY
jgi:hypothetical protein